MCNHLLSRPFRGNQELLTVRTHMVIFHGHKGRIVLEISLPGIAQIHIKRVTIALQFPYTRHGHHVPSLVVVVCTIEIRGAHTHLLYPVKFPKSVERHIITRRTGVAFQGGISRLISKVMGMHRQTMDGIYLQILQLCKTLSKYTHGAGNQPHKSPYTHVFYVLHLFLFFGLRWHFTITHPA